MVSMNSLSVIGRLGRDPSSKDVNGKSVCAFSIAVDGRKDGAGNKSTLWLEIRAWGKLAEICQKYLAKGRQVFVVGELRAEEWNGRDGTKRSEIRVIADKVEFLGGGEQSKVAKPQIDDSDIPF